MSQNSKVSKTAKSALTYYSQENRAKVRKEMPTLKAPDVSKELSKRWKDLSEEAKLSYKTKAKKDKDRIAKLNPKITGGTKKKGTKKKGTKKKGTKKKGTKKKGTEKKDIVKE
jgi:hypothetical protein